MYGSGGLQRFGCSTRGLLVRLPDSVVRVGWTGDKDDNSCHGGRCVRIGPGGRGGGCSSKEYDDGIEVNSPTLSKGCVPVGRRVGDVEAEVLPNGNLRPCCGAGVRWRSGLIAGGGNWEGCSVP